MSIKELPAKLYKYAAFNSYSLRLLSEGEAFYSDPKNFNDPLDCNPTIQLDKNIDSKLLEDLLFHMIPDNEREEKFHRIKTDCKQVPNYVDEEDGEHYPITDPIFLQKYYIDELTDKVKTLLNEEMSKKGVLALAERWDSALMWSHYADEHRGICIEYEMVEPKHFFDQIKAVSYESERAVKISDLISWKIDSSLEAEQRVISTYFFAKAPDWKYEQEWRDISSSAGVLSSSATISGVYFGFRCDDAVKTCIVKLLQNYTHRKSLNFYQISLHTSNFSLEAQTLDGDRINKGSVGTSAPFVFGAPPPNRKWRLITGIR